MKRFRVGKEIGVRFKDKHSNEKVRIFYHDGFKRKITKYIKEYNAKTGQIY